MHQDGLHPNRFERTILTRCDELDEDQLLSPTTLLRYFEYLRWEAVEDPGLSIAALVRDGHRLVLVGQKLRVLRDVGRNVELVASMWVDRLWRTGLTFASRLSLSDGTPIAELQATAAHLDPSDRPAPLPEDYRSAVVPHASLADLGPRLLGAKAPAGAWTRSLTVCPSDIDAYRHVNHARYVIYFDDARLLCAMAGGYGESSPAAAGRVRRLAINYMRQAFRGDPLEVTTWLLEMGSLALELRRGGPTGELLARAHMEVAVEGPTGSPGA